MARGPHASAQIRTMAASDWPRVRAIYEEGIGTRLLEALIEASEADGRWTLQAGVFPENVASVAVHESCGFRLVGRREKLGAPRAIARTSQLDRRQLLIRDGVAPLCGNRNAGRGIEIPWPA